MKLAQQTLPEHSVEQNELVSFTRKQFGRKPPFVFSHLLGTAIYSQVTDMIETNQLIEANALNV